MIDTVIKKVPSRGIYWFLVVISLSLYFGWTILLYINDFNWTLIYEIFPNLIVPFLVALGIRIYQVKFIDSSPKPYAIEIKFWGTIFLGILLSCFTFKRLFLDDRPKILRRFVEVKLFELKEGALLPLYEMIPYYDERKKFKTYEDFANNWNRGIQFLTSRDSKMVVDDVVALDLIEWSFLSWYTERYMASWLVDGDGGSWSPAIPTELRYSKNIKEYLTDCKNPLISSGGPHFMGTISMPIGGQFGYDYQDIGRHFRIESKFGSIVITLGVNSALPITRIDPLEEAILKFGNQIIKTKKGKSIPRFNRTKFIMGLKDKSRAELYKRSFSIYIKQSFNWWRKYSDDYQYFSKWGPELADYLQGTASWDSLASSIKQYSR